MKYLLGIDFGGGASKATLINTSGEIVAEHSVEYPTLHPELGACEQDPTHWVAALQESCQEILKKAMIMPQDILAVGLDSATHTSLICDSAFRPIRNAIHWTDTRSRKIAEKLKEEMGDEIFRKSFHLPDTIWTLPQLMWLRETEPENYKKFRYLFFEKDYLRYYLTDVFCTDYIEAEGSMLFDLNRMQWDSALCAMAGISPEMLPPVHAPDEIIGKVTKKAAVETGLFEGTPVICGTTDTAMEVFASGAVKAGDITVKLATAGRICVITTEPHPDRHLVNYSHISKGLWYPGTATKSCAASYRWYRDTFGGNYEELDRAAAEIPIGCNGLIFLPHLNGELTPYADPQLCGSFTGIRSTHTKAHFSRAVLEGVAYSLLDCKNYLLSLDIPVGTVATAIGGGTKGVLWRQMISDALGISLKITKSSDSSFGTAMLAGIAVGVFSDPEDAVEKCVKVLGITHPNPENTKRYRDVFHIYKKLHYALSPIYYEQNI